MNIVSNEFADVSVRVDGDANSPRPRRDDLRSGRFRLSDGRLRALLDPARDRWTEL